MIEDLKSEKKHLEDTLTRLRSNYNNDLSDKDRQYQLGISFGWISERSQMMERIQQLQQTNHTLQLKSVEQNIIVQPDPHSKEQLQSLQKEVSKLRSEIESLERERQQLLSRIAELEEGNQVPIGNLISKGLSWRTWKCRKTESS